MYSPVQMKYFEMYEKVRKSGLYNMLDSRAQKLSGLSAANYEFVMWNYGSLAKQELQHARNAMSMDEG